MKELFNNAPHGCTTWQHLMPSHEVSSFICIIIYIDFPEVPFHQQRGVMLIDGSVQVEDCDI